MEEAQEGRSLIESWTVRDDRQPAAGRIGPKLYVRAALQLHGDHDDDEPTNGRVSEFGEVPGEHVQGGSL